MAMAVVLSVHYLGTDPNNIESFSFSSPNDGDGPQTCGCLSDTPGGGGGAQLPLRAPRRAGRPVFGDGMETLLALDAEDQFDLTIIEPSFSIDPWYAKTRMTRTCNTRP